MSFRASTRSIWAGRDVAGDHAAGLDGADVAVGGDVVRDVSGAGGERHGRRRRQGDRRRGAGHRGQRQRRQAGQEHHVGPRVTLAMSPPA